MSPFAAVAVDYPLGPDAARSRIQTGNSLTANETEREYKYEGDGNNRLKEQCQEAGRQRE